jgi:hypothetical protein
MLNSKSCQNDKTENRHVALIYRQYIHGTRLSTQQEKSIQALCCKTLLLNWKCQNGEEKKEWEWEGIDTTSDMRIESKKAHLLHKVVCM